LIHIINHGNFRTLKEAIKAAKDIVDDFFIDEWKPGIQIDKFEIFYFLLWRRSYDF
jgi:hypothetical protein